MKVPWSRLMAGTALGLALSAAHAQESYGVYDAFSSPTIDASRWSGAERVRMIDTGTLVLSLREYGQPNGNTGRIGHNWGEDLTRPSAIGALRATFTATAASVTDCAANTQSSRLRARLIGTFFNTGRPVPGSYVGDLMAQIYLFRDSSSTDAADTLRVEAATFVCTSSDCMSVTPVGTTQSLGTVTLNTPVTLQMHWDKANRSIVFTRGGQAPVAVPYGTLTDTIQPARPLQAVALRADLENCALNQVVGNMTVRVDNVATGAQ